MEAHEVTAANIHLAVGALLTNQAALGKQLNSQDLVLLEIRCQTIRTNGRLLAAEGAIVECREDLKTVKEKACPGTCFALAEKVRSLEDSRLEASSNLAGAKWVIASAAAAGGVLVSVANWLLGQK